MKRRVWISWSSGKDSAWALWLLRQREDIEIAGLITTFNEHFDRVAMHAVRRSLVEAQARAAGLALKAVELPWPCSNVEYERRWGAAIAGGVEAIAFGDLFLEEIRAYREKQLAGTGIEPLFPVWGLDTTQLASDMLEAGLRAHVTCIDPRALSPSFAGRAWDDSFLRDLPRGTDPCGENGEFHTFVSAGPMFTEPVCVTPGEVVERDGFVFADLLGCDS